MLLFGSSQITKLPFLISAFLVCTHIAASVVVPSSDCYALDNSSYLHDFTNWYGRPFEYDSKDGDLVVRFCKDVERRSQPGYVDFGRYATQHYFVAGSSPVDFIQSFYNGDLMKCEQTFDKMGRTSQVNIVCGSCLNGACQDELGCICSVSYDTTNCRVFVELAIPCVKRGPRVFEGFTVGFHPRSWEVVYNGMTQLGFEKPHLDFSFSTVQSCVSLYLTSISTLSYLVGKPILKVIPDKGLDVKLSGSGGSGSAPTTLSPSIIIVNWRCLKALDSPYEVSISIPIEGYDPIQFVLTKSCDYRERVEDFASRGWATFGVLSCIFIILSTIFCCGGFIYRTRVKHQHGLDALPGMTILSACLEVVSGPRGYATLREDTDQNYTNHSSWEHTSASAQETQRTSESRYGSI